MTDKIDYDELERRVAAVANGDAINLTYRASPVASLDAFRADLLTLLAEQRRLREALESLRNDVVQFVDRGGEWVAVIAANTALGDTQ